jgi:VanZ family protein
MLVVLLSLPFRSRLKSLRRLNQFYVWIMIGYITYGIAIEFIQKDFIPHRSFDVFDIVADTVGCVTGYLVVRKLQ